MVVMKRFDCIEASKAQCSRVCWFQILLVLSVSVGCVFFHDYSYPYYCFDNFLTITKCVKTIFIALCIATLIGYNHCLY